MNIHATHEWPEPDRWPDGTTPSMIEYDRKCFDCLMMMKDLGREMDRWKEHVLLARIGVLEQTVSALVERVGASEDVTREEVPDVR